MKKRVIKKYHLKDSVKDEIFGLLTIVSVVVMIIMLYIIIY